MADSRELNLHELGFTPVQIAALQKMKADFLASPDGTHDSAPVTIQEVSGNVYKYLKSLIIKNHWQMIPDEKSDFLINQIDGNNPSSDALRIARQFGEATHDNKIAEIHLHPLVETPLYSTLPSIAYAEELVKINTELMKAAGFVLPDEKPVHTFHRQKTKYLGGRDTWTELTHPRNPKLVYGYETRVQGEVFFPARITITTIGNSHPRNNIGAP